MYFSPILYRYSVVILIYESWVPAPLHEVDLSVTCTFSSISIEPACDAALQQGRSLLQHFTTHTHTHRAHGLVLCAVCFNPLISGLWWKPNGKHRLLTRPNPLCSTVQGGAVTDPGKHKSLIGSLTVLTLFSPEHTNSHTHSHSELAFFPLYKTIMEMFVWMFWSIMLTSSWKTKTHDWPFLYTLNPERIFILLEQLPTFSTHTFSLILLYHHVCMCV